MVLMAALALVRCADCSAVEVAVLAGVAAFLFAAAIMAVVAWVAEKLVLRKLVNQEGIILFMATIGITFFLEGLGADAVRRRRLSAQHRPAQGADVRPSRSVFDGGILVNELDIWRGRHRRPAGRRARDLLPETGIGRALRAVADDHPAAQSVGIPLNQIWFIVWLVAGLVALVAGMVWGSKLGVQFSLILVALKALPVVILGGFTSVPGAIIGGLIIGAGEKLSEVFLGPSMGGGIEIWFAYVLALLFLLVRPQGLFGENIIDRV